MAGIKIKADWSDIRLGYLQGETFRVLSQTYGVKEATLRSRASREKWHVPPKRVLTTPEDNALSLQRAHELWQQRKERVKESEYKIAERILAHAETMPEDQLINKADKIKIGVDIGRRSVGMDVEQKDVNAVNIAILGDVDAESLKAMSYDAPAGPMSLPEPDCSRNEFREDLNQEP